jgi:hypothetical protein
MTLSSSFSNTGSPAEVQNLVASTTEVNALDKYSLRGQLAELEKQTVAAVPILGNLALFGQFTIIFAPPNTGKTLITLSLIMKAIEKSSLNPEKLYYLNMDDSGPGLLTKLGFAEEYSFNMLAEGENSFKAAKFLDDVKDLIADNQCLGIVIVLDTLKKFIDVMDKSRARVFTSVIRQFVQKGGTVIALGHTNKRSNTNGKAVYGGVSDFLDDADCAYIVSTVGDPDPESKVVLFENIKKRGDVHTLASYRYQNIEGSSYSELVSSVQLVGEEELDTIESTSNKEADAEAIEVVLKCIDAGIDSKMQLIKEVSRVTKLSNNDAKKVIEKYTGNCPAKHLWYFEVGARGVHKYMSMY